MSRCTLPCVPNGTDIYCIVLELKNLNGAIDRRDFDLEPEGRSTTDPSSS